MNSTRKLVVLALGLVALVAGCGEDPTIPPKPKAPPQVGVSQSYGRSSQGLPSGEVYDFLAVSSGEFWIGTNAGVARYPNLTTNERTGDVINAVNGLPHPQVRCMIEYNGKVYVGTWGGGLGVYDVTGGTWTQIRPTPTGLSDGFVASIAASPTEGRLYIATNNGVFIYDPTGGTFVHVVTVDQDLLDRDQSNNPPLSNEERDTMALQRLVSSVAIDEDAGVVQHWYGPRVEVKITSAQAQRLGILVSKPSTEYKYTRVNSGLVETNVNDIYVDATTNEFWVSYVSKGISEVNVTTSVWKNHTLVEGLPSNTVYAVTRAKDNESDNSVLWAATQNGLAKLINNKWQGYGRSGGLPSDRVRSLYSDDGVRLWVGFVDAGAVRIKV